MFMIAQLMVGPALVPGLMAAGLIFLAVGSVKLIGESLKAPEITGIIIMILAIVLLGASNLVIPVETFYFLEMGFLVRITLFSLILVLIMVGLVIVNRRSTRFRATSLALISGVLFALSNYWIAPMMGTIAHVFDGTFVLPELVLFAVACITLVMTNVFGLGTLQTAFKTGQANLLVPIQQIPIQVVPALVYLVVFALLPPSVESILLLLAGIGLIIISSFFLGRRQVLLEAIK